MPAYGTHKNKPPKIIGHAHSGRLRHRRHTSYASLLVLLAIVFAPLLSISRSAAADDALPKTVEYPVAAVVASPVPTTAPTITNLTTGQVITSDGPINVSGKCVSGTIVEIYKNQVMGGAQTCSKGTFTISVDLFNGNNSIIARAYNADGIPGPDSPTITVVLAANAANQTAELNATGVNQVYLAAEMTSYSSDANKVIRWPLVVHGGVAPYVITVDWGDGTTDTLNQSEAGQFTIDHNYSKTAGKYGSLPVTIKATDVVGTTSYLQLVANFKSGQSSASKIFGIAFYSSLALRIAWLLLLAALLLIAGFWIGERWEMHHLQPAPRPRLAH